MTALMICEMFRIAPLFGGSSELLEQKKWPPARLLACASLRYDASECTANIMSLALKESMASGCVAT